MQKNLLLTLLFLLVLIKSNSQPRYYLSHGEGEYIYALVKHTPELDTLSIKVDSINGNGHNPFQQLKIMINDAYTDSIFWEIGLYRWAFAAPIEGYRFIYDHQKRRLVSRRKVNNEIKK